MLCGWLLSWYIGQVSKYKGDAAKIFKKLEMIMIIYWSIKMFILLGLLESGTVTVDIRAQDLECEFDLE